MDTFLIGYGTLLHRGSLGHSIGAEAAETKLIEPVVVEGYRRLFNLRPTHYETSHKLSDAGNEDAAMNVEPAVDSRLNALAFAVTEDELRRLDERERYYERRKTPILAFESGHTLGEGHLYVGKAGSPYLDNDPQSLMPLWRDIVWARDGAYRIGEAFGRMFDETTYLADGRTLMIDAYRDALVDTSDVDLPQ